MIWMILFFIAMVLFIAFVLIETRTKRALQAQHTKQLQQLQQEYEVLEKENRRARKLEVVGRLACGISHDFNNILQVINGHTELLLKFFTSDPKIQHSLDIILSSGQKASELTRQLLLFSRKEEAQKKCMDLNVVITDMKKMLTRLIGEDVRLEFRLEKTPFTIFADESQLNQIILNLVINARDAMPKGGTISILTENKVFDQQYNARFSVITPGSYMNLIVRDTGIGMTDEVIEKIFEPFYTTKKEGEGTGLGLSTVYGIMKQNNVHVFVRSSIGRGTEFSLFFPKKKEEECIEKIQIIEEKSNAAIGQHILFVEDEQLIRDLAFEVLRSAGYVVYTAKNIAEARTLLNQHNSILQLVITDVILPDGTGLDFYEEAKLSYPLIPFILSSGYNEQKQEIQDIRNKGYLFLPKPYTLQQLLTICKEALKS